MTIKQARECSVALLYSRACACERCCPLTELRGTFLFPFHPKACLRAIASPDSALRRPVNSVPTLLCLFPPRAALLLGEELAVSGRSLRLRDFLLSVKCYPGRHQPPLAQPPQSRLSFAGLAALYTAALSALPGLTLHATLDTPFLWPAEAEGGEAQAERAAEVAQTRQAWRFPVPPCFRERVHNVWAHGSSNAAINNLLRRVAAEEEGEEGLLPATASPR